MKNKIKALLLIIMIASIASSGIIGCSSAQKSGELEKETKEEVIKLYDFERGLFNVRMAMSFGKITLNEDSNYVTEGKQSLKLQPINTSSNTPFMFFPFESQLLGFSYLDISRLSEIRFNIYSDKETNLMVGLYFSAGAELKSAAQDFKLKRGWNEISYKPVYSLISVQYALSDCKGFYVMFDGMEEIMPTAYIDDVKIVHSDFELEVEDLIFLKKTADYIEICDFEMAYQNLVWVPYSGGTARAPAPDLTIEKASEIKVGQDENGDDVYLEAPSGEKVLKINCYPKSSSGNSWTQIDMTSALLDAINFKQFAATAEDYELKFEIYQDCDTYMIFELNPYFGSGMDWSGVTTVKGKWVEFSQPLSIFPNFLANPSRFAFAWLEQKIDTRYVYYIDNIRIEKVK